MSIRVMSQIWSASAQQGTLLLMLLALADFANDDGVAWPSVPALARKCRVSERQARRLLRDLEAAGEIVSEAGSGRKHTSSYQLIGFGDQGQKGDIQGQKGDTDVPYYDEGKGDIQGQKGDIQGKRGTSRVTKGDIAVSPEPSVNRHREPSREPSESAACARDPPAAPGGANLPGARRQTAERQTE